MRFVLSFILVMGIVSGTFGADIPQPMPNTYIHDFAGVLDESAKQQLQKQAKSLKDNLNTEVAVVTMETLNGEDVFDYSLNLARQWGIGSKDNDVRGVLLLVVTKDRKTSIRTSRHIEGQLNDGITGAINREMGNYFKKGDFGGGLSLGLTRISDRLTETQNDTQPIIKTGGSYKWLWFLLVIPVGAGGGGYYIVRKRKRERAAEERRQQTERNRAAYFATAPGAQTGRKKKEKKLPKTNEEKKQEKASQRKQTTSHSHATSSSYDSSSSSSSSSSSYDSDYGSSSSYSSDDSSSSYSGGSDFGGGGSDSSW